MGTSLFCAGLHTRNALSYAFDKVSFCIQVNKTGTKGQHEVKLNHVSHIVMRIFSYLALACLKNVPRVQKQFIWSAQKQKKRLCISSIVRGL